MDNIQQILNSKKSTDKKNVGLSFPITIGSEKQLYTEYNEFRRINQLDQFYIDKKNCSSYRFYGHINEIVNLKYNFKGQPLVKPNFSNFDFTAPYNWTMYLMAPLNTSADFTVDKGDFVIETKVNGQVKNIDFNLGLPALIIKDEIINNKTRRGLLLYLGHNCEVNDVISLTDTLNPINNGTYRVTYVLGNKLYLQSIAVTTSPKDLRAVELGVEPMIIDSVKIGKDEIELGITLEEYEALNNTKVNWLGVINPHIFIKKMINKIPCEYYMKKLKLVSKVNKNEITNCAYEQNIYAQKTFLFTKADKINVDGLFTNLLNPVTDVYMTFIKTVNEDMEMTSVEANFANFIGSTFEYGGIQTVSDHYDITGGTDVDYSNPNNFLYHSLVEYNHETLREVQINHIEHTFISNTKDIEDNHIRFGFNPFSRAPIRKLSNTIDEQNTNLDAPANAMYSEKYQTYRWRHILETGYFETEGNGIDFPYMNDALYVYANILLNIKNYSSPRVSALLSGGYLISAYTDTLIQVDPNLNGTGNNQLDDSLLDKNKDDKPFEEFKGTIC